MAREEIVCRCEEVAKTEILKALEDGAQTVNDIKRLTRAGMGLCQARTCGSLVAALIAQRTGRELGDVAPARFRPPVRPIKLGLIADTQD